MFEGPDLVILVEKFYNVALENIKGPNIATFNPYNKAT